MAYLKQPMPAEDSLNCRDLESAQLILIASLARHFHRWRLCSIALSFARQLFFILNDSRLDPDGLSPSAIRVHPRLGQPHPPNRKRLLPEWAQRAQPRMRRTIVKRGSVRSGSRIGGQGLDECARKAREGGSRKWFG